MRYNMKNEKLKRYSIKIGIIFLIVLAMLTYISTTIDNILLPQVKIAQAEAGSLDGLSSENPKYLLPISSVIDSGDSATTFVVNTDENGKSTVEEVLVEITGSDELYYEITSDSIYSDTQVVYSTSKSISNGDWVYINED
jgi:hypothetical protein